MEENNISYDTEND